MNAQEIKKIGHTWGIAAVATTISDGVAKVTAQRYTACRYTDGERGYITLAEFLNASSAINNGLAKPTNSSRAIVDAVTYAAMAGDKITARVRKDYAAALAYVRDLDRANAGARLNKAQAAYDNAVKLCNNAESDAAATLANIAE